MASAWGVAWGSSWGISWGAGSAPPVVVPVRPPGGDGWYRPPIYVDDKGRPVDLKTYKARTANQAIQAAAKAVKELPKEDRPEAREALRALREAVAADVSERVAQEARSLASMLGELQGQLTKLEELAQQEALDEEALIILLLVA